MSGKSISENLAEFARELTIADIPNDAQQLLASFTLDQLTCQAVGGMFAHNALVRDYALDQSPPGSATVIRGRRHGRAEWAALANATAGHGFEMDDTHARALAHPGCVVVPSVLAVAEEENAAGHETIVALALGFEIAIRFGIVVQPSMLTTRGFHETCVMGVFGSAAAAGRLKGLDAPRLAHAFGIAGSHASGTIEYGRSGGEVKRLHAGLGAMGGIRAATLANLGLTGPQRVFEGEKGLFQAVAAETRPEEMLAGLGERWHFLELFPKQYCAAATIHGPFRALREIITENQLDAADIAEIVVGVDQFSAGHLGSLGGKPTTIAGAQFSLHYSLAMGAVLGGIGHREYQLVAEQDFADPAIAALASRVRVEVDPEATAAFPLRLIGRVRIVCVNGDQHVLLGQALSSWDEGFVSQRFEEVIGDQFGPETAASVAKAVTALLDNGPVRGAIEPLMLPSETPCSAIETGGEHA